MAFSGISGSMTRMSNSKGRNGSSNNKDIRQLDAAGTRKLVRNRRNVSGWQRQFRSSLAKIVRFFSGVPLRHDHMDHLRTTPFYHFMLPFVKGKISAGSVHGMQDGTVQFLMTYNKADKCFQVAGKNLTINQQEFDVIFGIRSGGRPVDRSPFNHKDCPLVQRRFGDLTRVKPHNLKEVLEECAKSTASEDVLDTCRIIIIYLLCNLFFIAQGDTVSGWMFMVCEDFANLGEYNWGQAVIDYLMRSVHTRKSEKVRGCTVLLQYWMCERLHLIKPKGTSDFPRFRRWKLKDMNTALKRLAFKDIRPKQVRGNPIRATDMEKSILLGSANTPLDDKSPRVLDRETMSVSLSTQQTVNIGSKSVGSSSWRVGMEHESLGATEGTPTTHFGVQNEVPGSTAGSAAKTPVTTDDLEHIPLGLWMSKHPELLKTISKQQVRLTALEDELKEWKRIARQAHLLNDKLQEEVDLAKSSSANIGVGGCSDERLKDELTNVRQQLNEQMDINTTLAADNIRLQEDNTALRAKLDVVKVDTNETYNTMEHSDLEVGVNTTLEAPKPTTVSNVELDNMDGMPTFHLLTQVDTPCPVKNNNSSFDADWMEPLSEEDLKMIDLMTSMQQLSAGHEANPQQAVHDEIDQDKSIFEMDTEHPITLLQDSDNDLEDIPGVIDEPTDKKSTSVISKRTRSKKATVTPVSVSILGKRYKRYGAYQNLCEAYRKEVDLMALAVESRSQQIWDKSTDGIKIWISDIMACIQKERVSNNLVDAYGKVLSNYQRNGDFMWNVESDETGTTLIFPSTLLDNIRASGTGTFNPIPGMRGEYRYMVFPILHKKEMTKHGSDHWTVLVLDRKKGEYLFYNSMLQRISGVDHYYNDAVELVNSITLTGKHHGLRVPFGEVEDILRIVVDAPQLDSNTVDCGVAVMYIVRSYFHQQPLVKEDAENGIRKMRKEIVEVLVEWGLSASKAVGMNDID